jgi:hypothetical protein
VKRAEEEIVKRKGGREEDSIEKEKSTIFCISSPVAKWKGMTEIEGSYGKA